MKLRRALRLGGWNVLLFFAGLALLGLAGEAWRRATVPFIRSSEVPIVFVPGVGALLPPHTEIRWTNQFDFWTGSRTNRLGFLDREPPSPERAAESCHITVIGDSFVAAREVPIADKFHVQLEEMAVWELPALDITTSAFGRNGTGQINQLAFYDEYIQALRPRLVVLVFVPNDFVNNHPLWTAFDSRSGPDPEHLPYVSAARTEDGGFRLRPPEPDYRRRMLPGSSGTPQWKTFVKQALGASWFFEWLQAKRRLLLRHKDALYAQSMRVHRMELLSRRPAHAPLLDGWRSVSTGDKSRRPANADVPNLSALFTAGNDSPFFTETLAFTAFALDEFKKRVERDGAGLVILASHRMSVHSGGPALLKELAAERAIPVIDHGDFIHRQGAQLHDAQFAHDGHWNTAGHRWAAQVLLEYLKRNQDVCE